MDVSCRKVGEMHQFRGEGILGLVEVVAQLAYFGQSFRVEFPQLERVVHSARDDELAFGVKVGAEDFVSVALKSDQI